MSAEGADLVAFGILCGVASLAAGGGSATRTPFAVASLGSVAEVVCRVGPSLRSALGVCACQALGGVGFLGWQDGAVKSSGSLWFGYGVVLLVTFVVGALAFSVWVLSKVF